MSKNIKILSYMAILLIINYVGSTVALYLRLPIYLDTIGTMIASISLGGLYGVGVAISSAILNWITTDIYAIYFAPVAIVIAILTSILKTNKKRISNLIFSSFIISITGTILASIITVVLFKGITSSGSSIFVQILHGSSLSLTSSVFIVQIITDYLDKFISILIAVYVTSYGFIKINKKNL